MTEKRMCQYYFMKMYTGDITVKGKYDFNRIIRYFLQDIINNKGGVLDDNLYDMGIILWC